MTLRDDLIEAAQQVALERARTAGLPTSVRHQCCANDEWRGRFCEYHQGYADGSEEVIGLVLRRLCAHIRGQRDATDRATVQAHPRSQTAASHFGATQALDRLLADLEPQ